MNRRTFVKTLPGLTVLAGTVYGSSKELQPIILPKPCKRDGRTAISVPGKFLPRYSPTFFGRLSV